MTVAPMPVRRARPGSTRIKERSADGALPALLMAPAITFLMLVTLPPFLFAVGASLTNWKLNSGRPVEFVGLDNYRELLHEPGFAAIVGNTAIYTVTAVGLTFVLGFGIALLLKRVTVGKNLYQTLLLLPMVSTPLVIALVFRYMYNSNYGVITWALSLVGITDISLLGDPATAMGAVLLVEVWQWTPFATLVLLAGLEGVPKRPYEAAAVDGASAWQTFRMVTLPHLKGVIAVVLLIRFMDSFRAFDLVYIMTTGGPGTQTETLILSAWRSSFLYFDLGRGAALSIVMLYVVVVTSWVFMRSINARKERVK